MDTKTQALVNALAEQRNQALNALAGAHGELAMRDERIAALQAELDALKAKAAEAPPA